MVFGGGWEDLRLSHSILYDGSGYTAFYLRRMRYSGSQCQGRSYPWDVAWDYVRNTSSDGVNWGSEQVIFKYGCHNEARPDWHFVIATNTSAKYILFYLDPASGGIAYRKSADDQGTSWSAPQSIPIATTAFSIQQDGSATYLYYGDTSNLQRVELSIDSNGDVVW
ncbi:MAG: hypothetical protein ABIG68_11860 [Acidobacteriota bacterium]